MNLITIIKSLSLVIIIYCSLILNNSLSSIFLGYIFLTSLLLSFIVADLLSNGYKFLFSNSPGSMYFVCIFFICFLFSLKNAILIENFLIFFGLYFYIYFCSFLNKISSLDDQLVINELSECEMNENFVIYENKGIFFNEVRIEYTNSLGFMTYADKKNFFDLIKNNNGYLSFNEGVYINFYVKSKGLRFFSQTKYKLIKNVEDIHNILMNLLIEK